MPSPRRPGEDTGRPVAFSADHGSSTRHALDFPCPIWPPATMLLLTIFTAPSAKALSSEESELESESSELEKRMESPSAVQEGYVWRSCEGGVAKEGVPPSRGIK